MDPPNQIDLKDEMRIDIYANAAKRSLVILTDRPFTSKLQELELDREKRRLYFIFNDGRRDLGDDITDQIYSILSEQDIVDIVQIDINTKEPVNGLKAPLRIIPKSS